MFKGKRKFITSLFCVISGLHREADETCALLGCYAANNGNFFGKNSILRIRPSLYKVLISGNTLKFLLCQLRYVLYILMVCS